MPNIAPIPDDLRAAYGIKRDYRKIDIFAKLPDGGLYYLASTNWARNLKIAREMYAENQPRAGYAASDLVAYYAGAK